MLCAGSVRGCGDAAYGDQEPFGEGDLHHHAGWGAGGEELGEEAVEAGEVGKIAEEHGGVDDEVEPTVSSAEGGVEVLEGLPGFGLEVGPGGFAGCGIDAGLTGDEEEARCTDGLGVGADCLEFGTSIACLSDIVYLL